MIEGNTTIKIMKKDSSERNELGQIVHSWKQVQEIYGFLDMASGDTNNSNFNALVQQSTHIFICDYVPVKGTASDSKVIDEDGNEYQITYIDDPMKLHQHLEIYLKYVGGGQNA